MYDTLYSYSYSIVKSHDIGVVDSETIRQGEILQAGLSRILYTLKLVFRFVFVVIVYYVTLTLSSKE